MSTELTNSTTGGQGASQDALERYQYLLRTASPDQIEKAHEEAFAAMSEEERAEVLRALSQAGQRPADASAASLDRKSVV